jgi:signal transduction histidine kinase
VRELTPELRAVVDLAGAAQGAYEVEDLLLRVCRSVVETFGFKRVSIGELVPEREEVVPLASCGMEPEEEPTEPIALSDLPLFERALETGTTVFLADVGQGGAIAPNLIEEFGISSLIVVPLLTGGRCLGFLSGDRGGESFELDEKQLMLLEALGVLVAVFLEKAIAHDTMREVDELKSNFIALASHELRTPTAVVHGIASTLQLRGPELRNDQILELRRTLYEQTDRLRRLVDQLLDLSRLEARGIVLQPQAISVRTRVEDIVAMVGGERSSEIQVDVASELEAVADPTAFDRIVSNLVVNALRYGELPIRIVAAQPDRHFRLAVEDSGDGVPAEFVPQLFERFTRSAASRAKRAEGAGLGLAIARSYAHAQGGELLYTDADPHGARFELVLPAVPSRHE